MSWGRCQLGVINEIENIGLLSVFALASHEFTKLSLERPISWMIWLASTAISNIEGSQMRYLIP